MLIQLLQKKCYLVIRLATNQNFSVYNMDIYSIFALHSQHYISNIPLINHNIMVIVILRSEVQFQFC